ncbi:MAG: hypothetical protein AABY79_09325 [Nitrospirota bacterium]
MTTTIKKHDKITSTHPERAEVLKKLNKSTQAIINSTILPLLKKKGAVELSIDELRKRLSTIKTPLSKDIIEERKKF